MQRRITPNSLYRLFDSPPIYLAKGTKPIEHLLSAGVGSGAVVLISLMWHLTLRSLIRHAFIVKRLRQAGYHPIIMCNERGEWMKCRSLGLSAVVLNQNQFIDEASLRIAENSDGKSYDAFYAAQARAFKRLHLAALIPKLYVLTYSCPSSPSGENDLTLVEPTISHADWNKSYVYEFDDVISLMHQSGCALALSRVEGAMWAVVEALLCGLPVVSTQSKGGRDRYFDSRTSKIVRATPQAVKVAVDEFNADPPDPAMVRAVTLDKIEKDRQATVQYFQAQILHGSRFNDSEVYERLFRPGAARQPLPLQVEGDSKR